MQLFIYFHLLSYQLSLSHQNGSSPHFLLIVVFKCHNHPRDSPFLALISLSKQEDWLGKNGLGKNGLIV